MKKLVIIPLITLSFAQLSAQTELNFNPIRSQINSMMITAISDSSHIMTDAGINMFFAMKTAKYFGSAGDLSMYDNYFFSNVSDGTLSFGRNFQLKRKSTFISRNLLSFGIQAKVDDGFSTIYSNDGWSGQMGVDIKYSHVCRGFIKHSSGGQWQPEKFETKEYQLSPDQQYMHAERRATRDKLFKQITKDSADFITAIQYHDSATKKEKIGKFQKKKDKAYLKAFAEAEVEAIEDQEAYTTAYVGWWSFGGHAPITGKTYKIAPTVNDPFIEREDWIGYVQLSGTGVRDSKKHGMTLVTASVKYGNTNSIESKELKETTIQHYRSIGGKDSILNLAEIDKESFYVGEIKRFNQMQIELRALHFLPGDCSWLGFSLTGQYNMGQKNTMNLSLGLPISLSGQNKEKDQKVNVELQFRLTDLTQEIIDSEERKFNYGFGLNVGIPFGAVCLFE